MMKKIYRILPALFVAFLVATQVNASQEFIGSKTSNKYHYPACPWSKKIKLHKIIKFDSPEEAAKAGYIPCLACHPPLPDKTKMNKIPQPVEPVEKKPLISIEEITSSTLGAKFVLIPAGTFMMGSPSNEQGRDNDEILHQVTISRSFFMQTTEVTQGQWKRVMENNPSHFNSCGDDCPVENVSWKNVQEFISKLNRMEGNNQYRLPTEAEWEYAARAETTTRFHSGNSNKDLSNVGWYKENAESKTHAVEQKNPNAFGLYDMHGNVWEWVQDWKGVYPSSHIIDPEGPPSGSIRVMRGGSWRHGAKFCRSAYRSNRYPGFRDSRMGFRLLRMR